MNHHSGGGGRPDLASVRAAADLVEIAGRYLQLRKSGNEHEALCPFHGDSDPSLRIYRGRDGVDRFVCFPCGAKGDALDFVAKIENVDVLHARDIICGQTGPIRHVERLPPPPPTWRAILPVPANAPKMDPRKLWNPRREGSNGKDGKPYAGTSLRPERTDPYFDAAGALLGYVLRCVFDDGDKWTPTVTYAEHRETGERKWCLVPFPEPRPLMGLDDLARRPEAPVLVVSGEKCRTFAADALTAFAVVTWPGGDNGIGKVDFSPLHGRAVTFWPDCDASGINAMREVAAGLVGASVRFLDVSALRDVVAVAGKDAGKPLGKGADLADLIEFAKWDVPAIVAWCRANVAAGIPGEEVDEPRDPPTAETQNPAEAGLCVSEAGRGPESGVPSGKGGGPGEDRSDLASLAADGDTQIAPDATPLESLEVIPARNRKKRGQDLVDTPATGSGSAYASITSWSALGLQLSDKGVPHPNLDNAARALELHSELAGRFWFDEFLQRILSTWNADGEPREWNDADDVRLGLWFQRKLGIGKMAVGTARDAVTAVAMAYRRNECREWLESLIWDQVPRLERLTLDGFGAVDDPHGYARAVGRCWLVGMAGRVLDPGIKVDTMPVFEGPQGIRKSTALRVLVGGRWFAEATKDPTKTDFFLELVGKMLVEVGEMAAFNRAEKEQIKRMVSCQADRYRAPYGRRAEDHPRMGVFAGTTNRDDWNQDETGARRFLPIACSAVDLSWIADNRDQLFAEAVARFYAGESWWDVPDEEAKRQQESRRDADSWEGYIDGWLAEQFRTSVDVQTVMSKCLNLPIERQDKATQMRVSRCLKSLGWVKVDGWKSGRKTKWWEHPDGVKAETDLL